MSNERSKDILFCILAFVAAIIVLVASFSYQAASAYFPQLLAVIVAILSALLGMQQLKTPIDDTSPKTGETSELIGFVTVALCILAYTGAMLVIGFPAATILFLTLMMFILGERRLLVILPVALGLTGLLVFLFFWFLGVSAPETLISL